MATPMNLLTGVWIDCCYREAGWVIPEVVVYELKK